MNNQKNSRILWSLFSADDSIFSSFCKKTLYPWELQENLLQDFLQNKSCNQATFPGAYFVNSESIFIEEGVKIAPGAMIEGPCYLGKGVVIGHSALIRAGTFLAPNVHIGHCSEICRSVFFENSKAPHFNYVGDSVIGINVNLGAHATLANLRLDGKNVDIFVEDIKLSTEKRKFGSLIGDDSSIGCNTVLNPGTIVTRNTKIPPLSVQKGFI